MKKKYIILSIITLVLLITFLTSFNYFKTSNTYVENNSNNQTKITKGISMNLEQTAGAGDYKTVTQSSWPTEGYKFNAELSRCENGSTLSWDDTKKAIVISGNLSDKCYVYFDIATTTYILPSVTKVTPTTKYNQITVTTTGTKGTNEISKYYYSINNSSYVEGTSTYTFTNLNEQTTYNIKVKVADTNGRMSNEYSLSATTDAYKLPTITDVTTSSTYNSITINVSGQNGDGTITEYYYSKDNGSNYVKSTSSSYTFTNLTSNTTFYIKVYVKDNNNRNSIFYVTNAQTLSAIKLSNYVISQYTGTQGSNGIYYHNSSLTNGASDNSYRYAGANPNNYVCFGTSESPCPTDNLYRIIGVIDDKVKLIKYNYATSALLGTDGTYRSNNLYSWSNLSSCPSSTAYLNENNTTFLANKNIIAVPDAVSGCSNWKVSELNTVNLNKNFLENINSDFKNIIFDNTWIVGTVSVNAKIGLINKNDYIFSSSRSEFWSDNSCGYSWGTGLSSEELNQYTLNNWIYNGGKTCSWTLEFISNYYQSNAVMSLITNTDYYFSTGYYDAGIVMIGSTSEACSIYPTFYLNSTVKYLSGEGTQSNPIRIEV